MCLEVSGVCLEVSEGVRGVLRYQVWLRYRACVMTYQGCVLRHRQCVLGVSGVHIEVSVVCLEVSGVRHDVLRARSSL